MERQRAHSAELRLRLGVDCNTRIAFEASQRAHSAELRLRLLDPRHEVTDQLVSARTLTTISNPDEDDIRIYPQCARCASLRQLIGKAMPTLAPLLVVA